MTIVTVEFTTLAGDEYLFRFEPHDLANQYAIVNKLVRSGKFTHLDSAYCTRALRHAVYDSINIGKQTFFIEVTARRNGTSVRQIMDVQSDSKEDAFRFACNNFCELFPTWIVSARMSSYRSYVEFMKEVSMHETLKVNCHV